MLNVTSLSPLDFGLRPKKSVNKRQSAGGQKGAARRWAGVSPEERSELMRAASRARWGPKKKAGPQNPAASQLARTRWEKLSPEERRRAMERIRKARNKRTLGG
jgi:predicted Fe-S protein YdhL (DUF1289 family)